MDTDIKKFMRDYPHICFEERWKIEPSTNYKLGECDAIVQALRYLPLSPEIRHEMLKVSLIKGAMATTAIEGNTLTEAEVKAIQEGHSNIPQSRKYLEQEVRNVLDALNMIRREVVDNHSISPVTVDLIRNFNRQVGKELGDAFESIPGEFRPCEVVVGAYRPPDHRAVKELMARMCEWLKRTFAFEKEVRPSFANGVIEAIVAHVYLVWIHPFGDGNGRTARLLEFYLLLRSGIPDTCAHILSNFYNETRSEYYRQLSNAGKSCDLTAFISYATQGLYDGLRDMLAITQQYQLSSAWRNYVYDQINGKDLTQNVSKRYAKLLVSMDVMKTYTKDQLLGINPEVAAIYAKITPGTIVRDLRTLSSMGLVNDSGDGKYCANVLELTGSLPKEREFVKSVSEVGQGVLDDQTSLQQ